MENADLIIQLTKRDILSRYRGSFLGLIWTFLNPLLLLLIYTFVFSVVFKAKFGLSGETGVDFAIILFSGLILHQFLAECAIQSMALVVGNPTYVTKVVFPLEILSVVSVLSSLFNAFISLVILLLAFLAVRHFVNWTVVFLPIVLLPFVVLGLGVSWLLSSLSVYIRDLGQVVGFVVMLLLFVSPIFYPVSALPPALHAPVMLNPLTFIIGQVREVVIFGRLPHWSGLGLYTSFSLAAVWLGYAWFQKTRKGFADVL